MRTDATIDKKQVKCPNASMLGYGKWKAQVGDLIHFQDQSTRRIARMIGRIAYAPGLMDDNKPIRNYILAVAITGDMLDHSHERWINPADVLRVESIRNQAEVIAYLLSDEMVKAPIDEIRRCSSEGWSSLTAYRNWFKSSRQL